MKLSDIKAGEWVVIDTNILVYANQRKSDECIQLLRRCASGEVHGIVPMPQVAELVHVLMLIEARENDWIERSNPARALAARPELVRRLSHYETQVREFLGLDLRIEPVSVIDLVEVMNIQREFGLLTNDALLLATARRLNCSAIATADEAFSACKGFLIYEPLDLT